MVDDRNKFKARMSAIRKRSQPQQGSGYFEVDNVRRSAIKAIETYLSLPLDEEDDADTYAFWLNYSRTTDKAQKGLCHLARKYLTPAATSTDVER